MELNLLYEKFKNAKSSEEISNCILEALKISEKLTENGVITPNTSPPPPAELLLILQRTNVLFYDLMQMIHEKNIERAEFLADTIFHYVKPINQNFFVFYYIFGRVKYIAGDYTNAAKFFYLYDTWRDKLWQDLDELSLFYRANCLAMNCHFEEAAAFYKEILKLKLDFPEVKNNLEIVKQNTNENLILEISSLWNFCAWQDVPIFINARDRVGVLKKLVNWLLNAGYRNLIILDNNSTYKKLLDYYSKLEKDSRVKVVLLKKNLGYKAIWLSNILEELKISTPYVYTDPDILPVKECPKDFVKRLFEILDGNHEIRKVGLSLLWEDITIDDKKQQQEREFRLFIQGWLGNEISYANVDTTFALYSNMRCYSLRFSLRTYGNLRCRHLPWYFDYKKLPEDEKYYLEHADRNSVTSVQNKITNKK